MGDLEYVRSAIRLARKYGPKDIKLFINDYNLESDWDSNKKLKSLINWIKKWEADGVTYVDGIGTQMHISYYMNANTQKSKENAIVNMFTLMAKTGKLVRVSELDMGVVDANGNSVPTSQMTEAMHHKMADFYEWIIKKYLEIVPPEQQAGICFWCPTDSPSNSGWRADTPVGIWTLDNYRKHVYAGIAKGLGGVVTGIDTIEDKETVTDNSMEPAVIYTLTGLRMPEGTKVSDLPKGIYIVNGKKVVK
jgi:GH35 family endo-1,4-beta-xylanase